MIKTADSISRTDSRFFAKSLEIVEDIMAAVNRSEHHNGEHEKFCELLWRITIQVRNKLKRISYSTVGTHRICSFPGNKSDTHSHDNELIFKYLLETSSLFELITSSLNYVINLSIQSAFEGKDIIEKELTHAYTSYSSAAYKSK